MEFTHEFRVSLPIEPAWELITDVELALWLRRTRCRACGRRRA